MLETFAALFAAHVVADFLVQTKGMVNRKTELGPMSGHIALVAVSAAIAIGFHGQDPNAWRALALLTVAHAMMDLAKTHLMPPDRLLPYLTDQAVHILTIVLLAHFFPGLVHDGFWRGVLGDDIRLLTLAYLLAGFGIFAVVAGNYAVQLLLSSLPPPPPAQDACPTPTPAFDALDAGRVIGLFERGLIFVFIVMNMPEGVAVLIAAKSILRIGDIQHSRAASEYVIVGTLASGTWAFLCAIALVLLLRANALETLPLLSYLGRE
jgi:hypothetical protein